MSRSPNSTFQSDFLVVGSGIAGLSYALHLADHGTVNIITKKEKADSSTNFAQGGIASVLSAEDSFDDHIRDTLTAGAGLCDEKIVEIIVREGPERVRELEKWGVRFTRIVDDGGRSVLSLGREGGHSKRRIAHADDLTGAEIERSLLEVIESHANVRVFTHHTALDLITEHQAGNKGSLEYEQPTCYGAYALSGETGRVSIFLAKAVCLATGGIGRVYLHTTNPDIATGDGLCMAYRAGATVANMEFIQFHPTTLYQPEAERAFLISEAVRGEGAILRNLDGEAFMEDYHPLGSLAPRDIVARAIDDQMKRRGENYVLLDATGIGAGLVKSRFPNIYKTCLEYGIDMAVDPIPVVPAEHYLCGGVVTDEYARTDINRLFACGETAHTGLHGANRLASNSLLEAVVMARRAAEASLELARAVPDKWPRVPQWDTSGVSAEEESVLISHDRDEIKRLMSDYVGIVRSDRRVERARTRIRFLKEDIEKFYRWTQLTVPLVELRNLVLVADLIISQALWRKESRGLHFNRDYPRADDVHWKRDSLSSSRANLQSVPY